MKSLNMVLSCNEVEPKKGILNLNNEFSNVANMVVDDIIFYYDYGSSSIQFIGKGIEKKVHCYNAKIVLDSISKNTINLIYEEDLHQLRNIVSGILLKEKYITELRILNEENIYVWHKIDYNFYRENNVIVGVIGKIINIEKEKNLEYKATVDLLTGCLNKKSTEIAIKQIIKNKPNSLHGFMVIDIDKYKIVNDVFGHQVGDQLLVELTTKVKSILRETDVFGRIGGDEFIVFLVNIRDRDNLLKKSKSIHELFEKEITSGKIRFKVTASIGLSVYPEAGVTFEDLYEKADHALYESKDNGRNNITLYEDKII